MLQIVWTSSAPSKGESPYLQICGITEFKTSSSFPFYYVGQQIVISSLVVSQKVNKCLHDKYYMKYDL